MRAFQEKPVEGKTGLGSLSHNKVLNIMFGLNLEKLQSRNLKKFVLVA